MEVGYALQAMNSIVRGADTIGARSSEAGAAGVISEIHRAEGGGEIEDEQPLTTRHQARPTTAKAAGIIQPRRLVCLSAFLAIIFLAVFALNKLTETVMGLAGNEMFLSRLETLVAGRVNSTEKREA